MWKFQHVLQPEYRITCHESSGPVRVVLRMIEIDRSFEILPEWLKRLQLLEYCFKFLKFALNASFDGSFRSRRESQDVEQGDREKQVAMIMVSAFFNACVAYPYTVSL